MIGLSPQQIFTYFFIYSFFSQVATAALRRKKMHEGDLDKLAGTRLQLETQVNTLESANINANTLEVMRKGANALKDIHNGMCVPLFLTSGEQILFSLSFLLFTSCNLFFFLGVCVSGCRTINKVDETMNAINEQRDIANEISELISNPANSGVDVDEVRKP
jgi:charged multivesicular body protein 4A/B